MKTKSLVFLGGVLGALLTGCSGSHPPLEIVPEKADMYAGYKGDASRSGYSNSDNDIEFQPLWQIKFHRPLFYEPAMAANFAFQPTADEKIHVIDINTGEEVAEIKIKRQIGTTPELFGQYMAVCEEGERNNLVVFDYIEGRLLWNTRLYRVCLQPLLYDNNIFWVDGKNRLNAAKLENGEEVWSKKIFTGMDTAPILCGENIYVTSRDSVIYCINPDDGNIIWRKKGLGRTNSSPACFDSSLYICNANGIVAAYNANSGDLLWSHDNGSRLFYSPSVDSQGVYFGSGNNRFTKLDRFTGEIIWDYNAGSPVRGTAVINAKAAVFSSLDYTVYVLDKFTGRPITSYVAGATVSASPVLYDNKLFIAAQDKSLNCFSLEGE